MDVKNLSWEQIKDLAEMAMKNGSDFSLTLCADGDCSLDISKRDYTITPITTTPTVTWNSCINEAVPLDIKYGVSNRAK